MPPRFLTCPTKPSCQQDEQGLWWLPAAIVTLALPLQVPEVTLHISPARVTQILHVMHILMPPVDEPVDPAPWVKAAEYTSTVEALAWQGFVAASSHWQQRFAVVYRGTLYLLQDETSPTILRQAALWQGRRIMALPPELAGGLDNVLAVAPAHVPRDRILEEPTAIVLRLQSDYMLQEWTHRLRHSAAQMRSVANWNQAADTVRCAALRCAALHAVPLFAALLIRRRSMLAGLA